MSEEFTEYKERFELVAERIYDLESTGDEGYDLYVSEVASYLCEIIEVLDKKQNQKDLLNHQKDILDDYESTFLNPQYSKKILGEVGGILSAVYADMYFLPVYLGAGRIDIITIFLELFVQIYNDICVILGDREDPIYELKDDIKYFYHDYSEIFFADSCLETIDPQSNGYVNLIKTADLSKSDYLYDYGMIIGDNELQIWEFLNTLSDDEIQSMADTFTEGYKKGFEVTRKDISKKSTVGVEYPIGFERVIRKSIENFEAMGFEVTTPKRAVFSLNGRGNRQRGVHALSTNRQFIYDHKDDKGYYYDKAFVNRRLEVISDTYEKNKKLASKYGGPAVLEEFGQLNFEPVNKTESCHFTKEQDELNVYDLSKTGQITNTYIPGDEYSFTIISYPIPQIGKDFEEIFKKTCEINTLDYDSYERMQSHIIDVLDKGAYVKIKGQNGNETDLIVALHRLDDPDTQTNFENCVADVNIPVGEVFTSPVLKGTNGLLHVSYVYLGDYKFEDLKIKIEDGMISEYSCSNFDEESENEKLIFENILFRHKSLPMGEFAIGTNTLAYRMARDFNIGDKLPILIAEKTGPHFAFGDTCYSHAEDVRMYNPNGKEVIARENECSALRNSDPQKAYFNCHTDITIPFEELGAISAVSEDGNVYDIILDGRFVVPNTEELNKPL